MFSTFFLLPITKTVQWAHFIACKGTKIFTNDQINAFFLLKKCNFLVRIRKKQYFCMRNQTLSIMKRVYFVAFLCAVFFVSCGPSEAERAHALVLQAQQMVDAGQWRQARFVLDSVHSTYPKQVPERRLAKALEDSIVYLEAQSNIAYTDTMLPPLFAKADSVMRLFRYEKNEKYEDHGKYIHRLLATGSNTSRNFLQAYVRDDRKTIVKSYYYGATAVQQQGITLSSEGEELHFTGSNHSFEADGWHEIMSLEDETALQLLNFISAHIKHRVRVAGQGSSPTKAWVYYLNDKEKQALSDTYLLGWIMKDIKRLEEIQQTARRQVERYERKRAE